MPIATPEVYNEMLDRAKAGKFAYPAINVTSTQTLHAALRGFAEAESDGIVQISTGGAEFLGGQYNKDMVTGAVALAEFAHIVAEKYPVTVALHTDHCPKDKLDGYVRPLLAISEERVAGRPEPAVPVPHVGRLRRDPRRQPGHRPGAAGRRPPPRRSSSRSRSPRPAARRTASRHEINDELYTTVDDALRTAEALGLGEKGRYLLAASFGNVHGVYKPGNVVLRPELLKELQEGVGAKYGKQRPRSTSSSTAAPAPPSEEIATALENGVVKMNLDTDTQYAFTRPVADHMFRNYDGVLKVDGEVGNKKTYDPRSWGKVAEAGMAERVSRPAPTCAPPAPS